MLQLHIPNQFLNTWIPTNCIFSDIWQRFKKCILNKWIGLQTSNFMRLTSLCKIDCGWWSQITGSHYMTAVFDISHMGSVRSIFLFILCLSVQLSWLVIVLTISLCCSKPFIPYLNTCEFQFFMLTFKDFHNLWPVNPNAHRSLYHDFILSLLWCSCLTHPIPCNNHYSLSIPWMT